MAVTLVEIASLAGVSRGTVDRALNNRGRVDPEVADRVRRIAAELGYRPNREGRLLALAKNPIKIGIIVQSVETMFMHMVFEEVMRTQAQLTTPGAEIYVRPIQGVDAERQLAAIDELVELGVNGLALSPAEDARVRARVMELSSKVPVVTFNTDLPESGRAVLRRPGQLCLRPRERRSDESPARGKGKCARGRWSGKQPCAPPARRRLPR